MACRSVDQPRVSGRPLVRVRLRLSAHPGWSRPGPRPGACERTRRRGAGTRPRARTHRGASAGVRARLRDPRCPRRVHLLELGVRCCRARVALGVPAPARSVPAVSEHADRDERHCSRRFLRVSDRSAPNVRDNGIRRHRARLESRRPRPRASGTPEQSVCCHAEPPLGGCAHCRGGSRTPRPITMRQGCLAALASRRVVFRAGDCQSLLARYRRRRRGRGNRGCCGCSPVDASRFATAIAEARKRAVA